MFLTYETLLSMGPTKAWAGAPEPSRPDSSTTSRLVLYRPGGEVKARTLHILNTLPTDLPGLLADGVESPDALRLFESQSFRCAVSVDDSPLTFERRGNQLTRTSPATELEGNGPDHQPVSVRWNDAFDTLFLETRNQSLVLQVEGPSHPLRRARHLARLAVVGLGVEFTKSTAGAQKDHFQLLNHLIGPACWEESRAKASYRPLRPAQSIRTEPAADASPPPRLIHSSTSEVE